ncbi:hypothetical protein F1847_05840 [Thermodesulfobacterium sp. TA1]|uniref:hypothetical protein n=1 Tax=Thermodesulfobacterium sp. TA1 TaxID=2234087 RepID=UPI001231E59A|nr:hypothetical protein [Thermodesulfobacterium sp. TA1]QER42285.1 hypothetical protein F1847_05840 [Thermodesulfobacterium sp. TA1]
MIKNWDELSESLSIEIKKEIAETYFREKIFLEEKWNLFKEEIEQLKGLYKRVFNNSWRVFFLLNKDEDLVAEFEKITDFPLRETCKLSKEVFAKEFNLPEEVLKKKLFANVTSSFALTTKSKFVKLFFTVYKRFSKVLEDFILKLKKLKKAYQELEEETQNFYKRFDLSYILNFFHKLSGESLEIGSIEDKEKVWSSLTEALKIEKAPSLELLFKEFKPLPNFAEIYHKLSLLSKKSYELYPENAKTILSYVY